MSKTWKKILSGFPNVVWMKVQTGSFQLQKDHVCPSEQVFHISASGENLTSRMLLLLFCQRERSNKYQLPLLWGHCWRPWVLLVWFQEAQAQKIRNCDRLQMICYGMESFLYNCFPYVHIMRKEDKDANHFPFNRNRISDSSAKLQMQTH